MPYIVIDDLPYHYADLDVQYNYEGATLRFRCRMVGIHRFTPGHHIFRFPDHGLEGNGWISNIAVEVGLHGSMTNFNGLLSDDPRLLNSEQLEHAPMDFRVENLRGIDFVYYPEDVWPDLF